MWSSREQYDKYELKQAWEGFNFMTVPVVCLTWTHMHTFEEEHSDLMQIEEKKEKEKNALSASASPHL